MRKGFRRWASGSERRFNVREDMELSVSEERASLLTVQKQIYNLTDLVETGSYFMGQ